jgi:antirestriction protein ArdC
MPKSPTAPKFDVYQNVTDRIIAQLEAGTVAWRKPWRNIDGQVPRNLVSGKPYRGINLLLLSMTPYTSPYWVTYKQAQAKGGNVRRGEKSTLIVFWKMFQVDDETAKNGKRTIPMLRHYNVFNVQQCDGLTVPDAADEALPDFDPIAECEAIWNGYNDRPRLMPDTKGAAYAPALDVLMMPDRRAFDTPEAYYLTLFHEATHSTGHKSRLARFEDNAAEMRFGSEPYAKEELIAEMGSAMLGTIAGLSADEYLPRSAAYIANWLTALRNDPKMVIQAAGKAQRAVEHITGTADDGSDHE